MLNNIPSGYDVVGMRLPNGMIKVEKGSGAGEVLNEGDFMTKYCQINEGVQKKYIILESING